MNSPLEIREVRLRGLPRCRLIECTGAGVHGSEMVVVHKGGVRQELSAQADIAVS